MKDGPIIVQGDLTVLAEARHPDYSKVRTYLSRFAELIRSPEYIHTYTISDVSIWNAISSGMSVEEIIHVLHTYSRYPVPPQVEEFITDMASRYGLLSILPCEEDLLLLKSREPSVLDMVMNIREIKQMGLRRLSPTEAVFPKQYRGEVKRRLTEERLPPLDEAGYEPGAPLKVRLRRRSTRGENFELRWYQREAVDSFWKDGGLRGGHGIIVLPCGAGKTIVGLAVMEKVSAETLIVVTSRTAIHQWIEEILDKTDLQAHQVKEYKGNASELAPVTLTTYQMLTYRRSRDEDFRHFSVFQNRQWGLIIYDEVHVLPAPVFRVTALIQSRRRLGLTATLIREDGREYDVFSLVGPKVYDAAWRGLESEGFIAPVRCFEVRVPMTSRTWHSYINAGKRQKFRIASENPLKDDVAALIVEQHRNDGVLVIGHYITQLKRMAQRLGAPIITGSTPQKERDELYRRFREGRMRVLIVSRVANFAVNLPDATVAVQISGTFGSRQEEAQRLGRILRPKRDGRVARFYSLVSDGTVEVEFAEKRQLFLAEQGYMYEIVRMEDLVEP